MTTKRATFISMSGGGNGGEIGAIVIGALGLSVGLLAIDHHYSRPGHSAFDQLKRMFSKDGAHKVGAAALDTKEIAALPAYAQAVIQKALATETDSATLTTLASNLATAGFPNAAAAVKAKAGASATTGDYYAGAKVQARSANLPSLGRSLAWSPAAQQHGRTR